MKAAGNSGGFFAYQSELLNYRFIIFVFYFTKKRHTIWFSYFFPAGRKVEGKFGLFGESGKCCISIATPSC